MDLLVVGMAPDLDPSFEKLYGYLNDDVTRRRASVGLALELCSASVADGWARSRLADRSAAHCRGPGFGRRHRPATARPVAAGP